MNTVKTLPVILLTGFLGAGKTTLLLRWLTESAATGRRMGVVMNEFGQESVDSQLIQRPDLPLEQVSGGCLCCASDDEIGTAVSRLVRSGRVDYLVIETSGLADPDRVIDVLTDPDLLPEVHLHAVVTVVDAAWYGRSDSDASERILAKKQIQFAHYLALSRCDLIDEVTRDFVRDELNKINPTARQVRLPFGLPEPTEILACPPAGFEIASSAENNIADRKSAIHEHSRYQSLTWRIPVPVDRSQFENFLSCLAPREVIRAKGFLRFRQSPGKLYVFQTVWGHHLIEEFPAKPDPDCVVVLIGPNLNREALTEQLRELVYGMSERRIEVG